jgi:hypothetical protein
MEPLEINAYHVGCPSSIVIRPAAATRKWMDETPNRFVYRCLPMVVANRLGWVIENPTPFEAIFTGGSAIKDVIVTPMDKGPMLAISHFGSGVLTFHVPWLFQTPPGWNLLVRGPSNSPKHGIGPLEGLVETDHAHQTFTMNWRFTAQGVARFERGEPICMIVPQHRGDIERFTATIRRQDENPELSAKFEQWGKERDQFNTELKQPGSDAHKAGWQRTYMQSAEQTNIKLCPFTQGEQYGKAPEPPDAQEQHRIA